MEDDPDETGAPPWLDVDDLEPPASRRGREAGSRRLLLLAGVPWAVAGLVLWRGSGNGPGPATAAGPAAVAGPAVSAPAPSPTGALVTRPEPPTGTSAATLLASGALTAVSSDEARAVAVVTARSWLTTVGPGEGPSERPGDGPGRSTATPGRYAEHLVVEGIDHPAPGAAVVTVRAVVLTVAGDDYDAVEVVRLAVPLRFDATGAVPAGDPYLLPRPPATDPATLPGLEPVETTEQLLAAGEALTAAGYHDVEIHTLHTSDGWPYVATADVRTAPDDPPTRITVWLREHLGRFVVAGTRPATPVPSTSASATATPPEESHP